MDIVTNETVRERIEKEKEVMLTIERRKLKYVGRTMTNDNKET